MSPNPYRHPAPTSRDARDEQRRWRDADLAPVVALVWVACALRVAFVFARHQTFGVDASLAVLVFVVVPVLAIRGAITAVLAAMR